MATLPPLADDELDPRAQAVFADLRATRGSDFVNNFWRCLAHDPAGLERVWGQVKAIMGTPGALDPVTRELIYVAVAVARGCDYCVHSHTAAARAKGMTAAQHGEFLAIVALAAQTTHLAVALGVPVDPEFQMQGRG